MADNDAEIWPEQENIDIGRHEIGYTHPKVLGSYHHFAGALGLLAMNLFDVPQKYKVSSW